MGTGSFPTVSANNTSNTQLHTDVDVTFSMSGETDNGLAFGISVDLDEAGKLGSASANNGTATYISSGALKLTVGDTDGGMDFALTEIVGPGSIIDNETAHDGFKGNYLDGQYDGQIARVEYTMGDFAVAASTEILDDDKDNAGRSSGYAIGAQYTTGGITFGVGYQTADSVSSQFGGAAAVTAVEGIDTDGNDTTTKADDNIIQPVAGVDLSVAEVDATGASISGTFGAVTMGVAYTTYDSSVSGFDADHTAVGVSYTMGDFTLGGNWGEFDSDTAAQDREGYGITANYALGGGAVIQAGYESSDVNGVDNGDSASLGIAMSF